MAGPNFFETINPTLAAQQLALQRQQALASSLMGQGMQPISPTQNAGRYVVPITPMQGLAKVGEGLVGALMQRKIDEKQLGLAQQQAQMLQSIFGAGQPSQMPSQADVSQVSLGQGAQQGDIGPTVGNAQRMDQISQQLPTQAQQTAAQGGNPMVLPGMSGPQSMYMYAMDPNAYMTAALKPYSEGPINVRPGGTVYDPRLHRPMFTAPNLPQGSMPIYGPNGEILGSQIVQGAPQAIATSAGAEAAGRFPYQSVTTAGGAQVPAFTMPNLMQQMPQVQGGQGMPQTPQGAPQVPQGQGAPQGQVAPQGMPQGQDPWQTVPRLQVPQGVGQTTYNKEFSQGVASLAKEKLDKFGTQATEANQRLAYNNQALDLIDKSDTGPYAGQIAGIKNLLTSRFGIPESDFQVSPSATLALQKDLVQAATQKAKQQFGSRITQSEVTLMLTRGSPNVDMTKAAMKYLIDSDNQQLQYNIKQANDFGRYLNMGGNPALFEGWYSQHFPMTNVMGQVHLGTPAPQANPQDIVDELRRRGVIK